jgi:hypothetical protein
MSRTALASTGARNSPEAILTAQSLPTFTESGR